METELQSQLNQGSSMVLVGGHPVYQSFEEEQRDELRLLVLLSFQIEKPLGFPCSPGTPSLSSPGSVFFYKAAAVTGLLRCVVQQVTFPGNVPTENSLPQQAQQLTDSLRNSMEIDFERDWKFITVFVDLEELCNFCDSEEKPSLEKAVKRVKGALEILYRQGALQQHLVDSGSYSDREDFTVVLHPTPDMSPQAGSVSDSTVLDRMSRVSRIALELWGSMETGSQLSCSDRQPSTSIPTSVHSLRPADIKVIGAVGDSLTAGNGIGSSPNNLLDIITEYRGLSWSVGGDGSLNTVTTLPNILRQFNTSLEGFSLRTGKVDSSNAFLNQAVPGATSVPQRIDFQNDWKVVTLFIGGNDLCHSCEDKVPRVFVNLVETFHIIPLRKLHQDTSLKCPRFLVNMICGCVTKPHDDSMELKTLSDLNRDYQRVTRELVDSGRYDTQDNFTVVLQPFFREVQIPLLPDGRADRSYFAPDCFHLSQKAQSQIARTLWNNMDDPFLRTYRNSKYSYPGPLPTQAPIKNFGSDLSCTDRAPSENIPTSDCDALLSLVFLSDIPEQANRLVQALRDSQVPRVFVNLVEILQIEGLRRIKSDTLGCTLLQTNLCPCSLVPGEDSMELSEFKRINREYQEETERLVSSGRYDGREDFTVVVQPFFRNSIIPLATDGKPDLDFFSVDCFHFKERGQAEMSIELWHNMLEPVGQKHTFNNFTHDRSKLKCPSQERPYFFTRMNSFPDANPTAVSTTPPSIGTDRSVDTVPQWVAMVTAGAGLLAGAVLAGLFVSWRVRASLKQKEKALEMKQNAF
ncbi:Phospholipase B1, membrane-associated [Acipenser ruthenus]|uniref:Phospholipase B1, membrane-associated n=1 Tax=Acipenser ruthenus TaxID=7906 RepID=A0A444U0X7_ACIRT|nr:Phospholipase B1, membrane-associated [Acipenser ruthenus]